MAVQDRFRFFECLFFIPALLLLTTLSATALISLAVYVIVYLLSCFLPNYGNFAKISDVLLDEDFENSNPLTSLVVSLTLQGNLSLEELRILFTKNVLNKRSKLNPSKLRYPKLQQYLTNLVCFRVWKNDPSFLIENHIVEKIRDVNDLGDIHQEYLQKPYHIGRSPWELILIKSGKLYDDSMEGQTSYLVLRIHHVMADAKSVLKLLVECLGNKPVKTANPQYIQQTQWDKLRYFLCVPYKSISENIRVLRLGIQSFHHPWKMRNDIKTPFCQMVVAFSPKISLSSLKQVARQNRVNVSAVVMSIVAGAIKQVCGDKWDKRVAVFYPLPKPNHPECLTNHVLGSVLDLATDTKCEFKRLQKCNEEFNNMRDDQRGRNIYFSACLGGLQIYPINRLFCNMLSPIVITNNAGEEEGFSVGNTKCIDYRMTVGPHKGSVGVVFCTMSYKDGMRIALIAMEAVLSKDTVKMLANHIEFELENLLEKTDKV